MEVIVVEPPSNRSIRRLIVAVTADEWTTHGRALARNAIIISRTCDLSRSRTIVDDIGRRAPKPD